MGRAGLGCSVTVDMRLNKTLSRTPGARWGKSAMGRSACLLPHGTLRGGTSDAATFEAQQNHLLASYNNQQKNPHYELTPISWTVYLGGTKGLHSVVYWTQAF